MSGFIFLHRSITEDWVYQDRPFCKSMAWVDLLMMANYREKQTLIGDQLVTVPRGSFITSERKLADKWGWDRKKVRRFLDCLATDQKVTITKDHKSTTVNIINYARFQDLGDQQRDHEWDQKWTSNGPELPTTKERNKGKNNNTSKEVSSPQVGTAPCPHQEIIQLWHEICPHLPQVKCWSEQHQKSLRARWKESKARQTLEFWRALFNQVKESDFLSGRVKEWSCSLGWLVGPKNFAKVINGEYQNRKGSNKNEMTDEQLLARNAEFRRKSEEAKKEYYRERGWKL